jgi:hypothetical protein
MMMTGVDYPPLAVLAAVSAKAASMMRSERGSGETIYRRVVRQMTTDCEAYVFTTSTVPASRMPSSIGDSIT